MRRFRFRWDWPWPMVMWVALAAFGFGIAVGGRIEGRAIERLREQERQLSEHYAQELHDYELTCIPVEHRFDGGAEVEP